MPSGPGTYGNKVGRPPKRRYSSRIAEVAAKGRMNKKDKRKKKAPEAKSQSSTLPFFEGSGFGDFDKQQPSDPSTMRGRGFAPFDKKKAKKSYNTGGKVRGAGKATQGVRKCKMVTMKGT